MGMDSERLRIGSITKPHGLKGGVKVYPLTDDLENFAPGNHLFVEKGDSSIPVTIRSASRFKNLMIITFEEFTRIEEVEGLREADLMIPREDARALAENEYFISDLIGLSVVDEDDQAIGVVREVLKTGANDVYTVAREGASDLLIPAIKDCILEVDIQGHIMRVRLMPGME